MEDNKVRERLAEVIDAAIYKLPMTAGVHRLELAKAILQSPDLRVTLVEPTYRWIGRCVYRFLEVTTTQIAECVDSAHAKDYCDWLNSKEPK